MNFVEKRNLSEVLKNLTTFLSTYSLVIHFTLRLIQGKIFLNKFIFSKYYVEFPVKQLC